MVNRPAIILADEPTANLDTASANDIFDIFHSFQRVGVTVLIVTHDAFRVHDLRPRILRLDQGEMTEQNENQSPQGAAQ